MVSIKMPFCWQTLITIIAGGVIPPAATGWRYSGAAALEEASLCPAHSDVFPGACTDHSAVHQRGIMTIYIQRFPYIKFPGAWPCCGGF